MAQVVLITGGRGGAGKSVVCALLGQALAQHGQRVLLLEGSRRSLDTLLGLADEVLFDLSDALARRCSLADAILEAGVFPKGCLRLLCAPAQANYLPEKNACIGMIHALAERFDWIFIEVDGLQPQQLEIYAAVADRAVLVSAADRDSARAARLVSDMLVARGIEDIRLCVNKLPRDFAKRRPVPDLDWMIDQVCAQLICVLPYDRLLEAPDFSKVDVSLSKLTKKVFDNFAQRIMGYYIDLLVQ